MNTWKYKFKELMSFLSSLKKHTLYLKLLVMLFCIAFSAILIQAGSLFLLDYIPVSQSANKKIHNQELLWGTSLELVQNEQSVSQASIMQILGTNYLNTTDPDFAWLDKQENPELMGALKQLKRAQQDFESIRRHSRSVEQKLTAARLVVSSYEKLGDAIEKDIEIKQSVISLLHMLCFILIMVCIVVIALEARRILVDRLDLLVSFIPEKYINASDKPYADEIVCLEQKVISITARLEGYAAEAAWINQTNQRLRWMINAQEYLFKFVEIINSNLLNDLTLRKLLHSLDRVLDASNAAVLFFDDAPSASSERVVFTQHIPAVLPDEVCREVMASGSTSFIATNIDKSESRYLAVLLSGHSVSAGLLLIATDKNRFMDETEIRLVEVSAALITMVLGFQSRDQEGRRIALLEERSVIARELHDSLAQSLSFMKIQIARLQSGLNMQPGGGSLDIVAELREGLNTAYSELRELLATFRVHMDVRGLGFSIQSAIDEFSQRSSLTIMLDNRLVNCRLTVNEEFHILHVVREALSNIVRHSGAGNVWVALEYQSATGLVTVTIDDDGRGYTPPNDGQEHYGQAIMQERAFSLGGNVEVLSRRRGGTRVRLRFTPKLAQ